MLQYQSGGQRPPYRGRSESVGAHLVRECSWYRRKHKKHRAQGALLQWSLDGSSPDMKMSLERHAISGGLFQFACVAMTGVDRVGNQAGRFGVADATQ
jgi:hypothetical protein